MKTLKNLTGLFLIALFLFAFSPAVFAGEAVASETAKGGEKCACISSVGTHAGVLNIKSITVTDLFGNETELKPGDYTISGGGSTSPSVTFATPLAANSHVYIELRTGRAGDHGYMKMSLKKGTTTRTGTRCNCP